MVRGRAHVVLAAIFLLACSEEAPVDAPDGGDPPCEPITCSEGGAACGPLDDGCGGELECGGCGDDRTCVSGACLLPDGANGAPCSADGECQSGGCFTEWYEGHCDQACQGDAECTAGGHCAEIPTGRVCLPECESDDDCRGTGYACLDPDDDGVKECVGAGSGPGAIGDACAGYWECGGGIRAGCISGSQATGDWPDGYCTRLCGGDAPPCPGGSTCVDLGFFAFCFADCAGPGECRDAYDCRTFPEGQVCHPPEE